MAGNGDNVEQFGTPMPGRRPHHHAALMREPGTTDAMHQMARSMWAIGLEVPAAVWEHVLDNWEALLAEQAGTGRRPNDG